MQVYIQGDHSIVNNGWNVYSESESKTNGNWTQWIVVFLSPKRIAKMQKDGK